MAQTAVKNSTSYVGLRLKEVRLQHRLTLQAVSQRTGVSVSTLSKIENGQVSPLFDVIMRISNGLAIPLEDFVNPGPKSQVSGRKTVTRLEDGVHFHSDQYDYKAHAMELASKGMVPLEMRVRARSIDEFERWSSHEGQEYVYVLEGEIEVHTEHYSPFALKAGESAYFDSNMRHAYVSLSQKDARVLSVSYDPKPGAQPIVHFMNPTATAREPEAARKRLR